MRISLLIKFINAHTALLYVHPDDEYALINERQFGKARCGIYATLRMMRAFTSLNQDTNREELKTAIERGEIERYLNLVKAKRATAILFHVNIARHKGGDDIEVQQSSDVDIGFMTMTELITRATKETAYRQGA